MFSLASLNPPVMLPHSKRACREHRCGYKCPPDYNPADYVALSVVMEG